jgi:hypothetical protein
MGSGHHPSPQVCDLVQMTVPGIPGGAGDWVELTALQTTGGSLAYGATATVFPYVSVRWVAALSGTAGLAVPSNDAWVSPASFVTSAFLNKNIRDTIRFLCYPPIYRAHYTATSVRQPRLTCCPRGNGPGRDPLAGVAPLPPRPGRPRSGADRHGLRGV